MATLDDSPSMYLGQQWTHWAEKVEGDIKDDIPTPKEEVRCKEDADTIKLRHQDMPLYGLCPARDEFYLVVCECCGQVIKPQALKKHIEQRHGRISPRASGIRKSKGSPGRHSGLHTSPKHDTHGKTPPPGSKNSAKSSGSSHRSGSNVKSRRTNHTMPVVKVERMQTPLVSKTGSSSPKLESNSKRHEHRDHKDHHRDHRDHREKDHRDRDHRESRDHKDSKEHKELKDHKEHREHKEHKEKDHKEKDHKEKEHKEKDHKEKDHKEKDHKDKDHKDKDHKDKDYKDRDHKDRDHKDKEKDHKDKEKDHKDREKDHKDKEKDHRERDHGEKEKDHKDKEHKDHKDSKDYKDHKDHKEKKSSTVTPSQTAQLTPTTALAMPPSQTPPSATPPRQSSQKLSTVASPNASASAVAAVASLQSPTQKPKVVKEKMLPCKDREFDANKHCGVWIQDIARQCTRSLTCKTHALSLRRAVLGRRKPFDELLKEHRAAKEAQLKAKAEERDAAAAAKAAAAAASSSSGSKPSSSNQSARDSSKETASAALAVAKAAALAASPVAKSAKQITSKMTSPPSSSLGSRSAQPPAAPKEESRVNESCSRQSSDAEDDDDPDKLGYPQLSYHPQPAAINNFGGRCYAGSSCIIFNRRADLLRAAFQACVERHLHPPPHKKLCVESKLPQGSHVATNAQDPYEFPAMEAAGSILANSAATSLSQNSSAWSSNKLACRVKPKSSTVVSRTVKPKDATGGRSPIASSTSVGVSLGALTSLGQPCSGSSQTANSHSGNNFAGASTTSTANSTSNSQNSGFKRKRSGTSPVVSPGVSTHPLAGSLTVNASSSAGSQGNPFSLTIPAGSLNLSSLSSLTQVQLNQINAAIKSGTSQHVLTNVGKNDLLKDLNIVNVVTSMDQSLMNGQLVATTTVPPSAIADITHLQLHSMTGENTSHRPKKEKRLKSSHSNSSSSTHETGNATVSPLTSLPGGVLVMPDPLPQGTSLSQAFSAAGLLTSTAGISTSHLSPSTTASPLFASSSPNSQVSPLSNGVLTSPTGVGVKGLQVNHVAGAMMVGPMSGNSTPSPSCNSGQANQGQHNIHHRLGSKSKNSSRVSKSHMMKAQVTQQVAMATPGQQQLTAAAITLTTQPNRLLSTALPTMYTMGTSGQLQHIQIQPKTGAKQTLATGKLAMQPFAIPMVPANVATVTTAQQQAHATLLLQSDDVNRELAAAHHTQQLQNSPSNVIS